VTGNKAPDNGLVKAVLTTMCCCLPFGVVAIAYAAQVDTEFRRDAEGARDLASKSHAWSNAGLALGACTWLVYVAMALAAKSGDASLSASAKDMLSRAWSQHTVETEYTRVGRDVKVIITVNNSGSNPLRNFQITKFKINSRDVPVASLKAALIPVPSKKVFRVLLKKQAPVSSAIQELKWRAEGTRISMSRQVTIP
jgi:hypothetical protein